MGLLQELRRSGIGATDASAVLGLNPWRTPLQVWAEKTGRAPEQPQTEPMRWGLLMEPLLAAEYERRTGRKLYAPENVLHHPKHDFILCSPDRLVVGERRGVELKTVSGFAASEWGQPGTDQVPQHYLIQCLQCMAVTGMPVWDCAPLIGGNDYRIYTVRFDADLWADIEARLVDWWHRYVLADVEPPAMAADVDWLVRRYPESRPPLAPASDRAFALACEYKAAWAEAQAAIERSDAAKAALQQLIGESDGLQGEGWRVTWKSNRPRTTTDWEAVARSIACDEAALAEAATRHTVTKPGARVFRFTEKENA